MATLRQRLDERYARILRAVNHQGGAATTSEIKALTGIDTNQVITQRMDRLEEWGLVTTSYEETGNSQQMATKKASLTRKGEQAVKSGLLDEFLEDDRVESIGQLNDRVDRQERRIAELEDYMAAVERFLQDQNLDLDDYR